MSPRARELLLVAGVFLALAIVTTYPLAVNLRRALPSDLNDTLLNTWILGWDADRLRHGLRGVWDPPIFFPYRNTLAFSENLLGLAIVAAPVFWATGNAVLTYNVAFLLSFALAGVGMYLLALALTGSRPAAAVGAVFYAFCPFRFAQMAHIQMVATGWMPIGLYALHRYFATGARRWLALGCVAYWLQAATNSYVAYFMALPATAVVIDAVARDAASRARRLRELAAAALLVAAAMAPIAYRYYRVRVDYGQVRVPAEIESLAADLRSYVVGKTTIGIWRWLPTAVPTDPEKELFPGIVAVLLTLVGIAGAIRDPVTRRWVLVYGGIGAAALILSMGPVLRVWGTIVAGHAPYEWLLRVVPGWGGMRVPARFAIVVMLALSVLAAFGARLVFERLRPQARWVAAGVCAALLLAESWSVPLETHAYSPRARPTDRAVAEWLSASAPGAVLHLPILTTDFQELHYQFATLLHRHPIVNGYSGYETPLQSLWRDPGGPLLDFERFPAVVRMLRSLGVRYVVVNPADYNAPRRERGEAERTLDGLRGSGQVVREQRLLDAVGFELQPSDPPPVVPENAVPLGRGEFVVSVAQAEDRAANLVDGDPDTRWFGDQDGGTWIAAALPRTRDLAAIELQMAARSRTDYPRELRIESTDADGATRTLYDATPYGEFVVGFVRSAAYPRLTIVLPPNATRLLRIRETGSAPQWWSVHELRLWRRP